MIELIVIMDKSGSMAGLEADVIGGVNNFITEQQQIEGKAKMTLVQFDNEYEVILKRVPIQDVKALTEKDYKPRGSTALLDAVGRTLSEAKQSNKGIVFIFTDGQENSSREFTKDKVKKLIQSLEKDKEWEIHFVGADIDAYAESGSLGIDKAALVGKSAQGMRVTAEYMSASSTSYRGKWKE